MNFDTIFGLFLGPLLVFGMLTARDMVRARRTGGVNPFGWWRFNLVLALVTQICVYLVVRLRDALIRGLTQ